MDEGQVEKKLPLKLILESLLFVAAEPVAVNKLATVTDVGVEEVEAALGDLAREYQDRGFRLQRNKSMVQLVSAPETAPYVERLLGLDLSTKLSTAALETLGIIAYRQPVTRAHIETIRGVSCDGVLRTLLGHGLIEECGRLEQAGRPILYGTTFEFLRHFGLTSLNDLPPLDEGEIEREVEEARQGGVAARSGLLARPTPFLKE